jgi:hypothetical protein
MNWRTGAIASVVAVAALPAAASAAPAPPGSVMSTNLEYVARIAGANGITEGKFDRVRGRDILVTTGRFGFKTYDVTDPANPLALATFLPPGIDTFGYWQNEDMELDTRRNLIIGALDPRHNDSDPQTTGCPHPDGEAVRDPDCKSGFYVISYDNPSMLRQIGSFVSLPAGHTASCIQDCRYIWTGGPARRSDQDFLGAIINPDPARPASLNNRPIGDGRPIYVTDLTDPSMPVVSEEPVDLWRNDGYTDYSHDVDEDDRGIAWVSGRGGIRGYATSGRHRDPFQNRWREASPFDPILVAGGGLQWDDPDVQGDNGVAQPVMFMHNSGRPTDGSVRASGVRTGNILVGTEEEFTRPCGQSGRIVLADITDSLGGERAASSTRANPYRMRVLDSFHPFLDTKETANPELGCSAHYFEIEGPMLGAAWYGQGLRLLDISNARDVRQVGFYRNNGTNTTDNPASNSWDMAFRSDRRKGDLVYLFDMSRGVEILRMKQGAGAARKMKKVTAPSARSVRFAAQPVGGLQANASSAGAAGATYICPIFY